MCYLWRNNAKERCFAGKVRARAKGTVSNTILRRFITGIRVFNPARKMFSLIFVHNYLSLSSVKTIAVESNMDHSTEKGQEKRYYSGMSEL